MNYGKDNKNTIIEECLISLAEGNIEAMDVLYELIKKDTYAFALSKVKNKFDADDILQDTFVRIYENAKLYTSLGKPMSWIFTVESNVINRYFQLKNKQEIINNETIINNIIDSSTNINTSDKLIKNEYLNKLLDTLNDFEREVISLHLVSDMKFREIADYLNKPLSTILSKYNRAIKKLKKISREEI